MVGDPERDQAEGQTLEITDRGSQAGPVFAEGPPTRTAPRLGSLESLKEPIPHPHLSFTGAPGQLCTPR